MKYPVRMSSQVMMNAMVDANSNYPSADEIAQALNDGERYKKALNEILQIPSVIGCQPYLAMRKIAADALREGAGDERI